VLVNLLQEKDGVGNDILPLHVNLRRSYEQGMHVYLDETADVVQANPVEE
jgi:hypothetical protein